MGETLGEGAFGVVYACVNRKTHEEVAVKMVDKVETPVQAIKEEADMLQALDHPNIVKFHQVIYERCFVCIVMDKYKGGDLVEGMQTHWKTKGKIPCHKCIHVSSQMAQSIAYLHSRNIVHRDVKGDNYLMDRKDIGDQKAVIVLSDFGTAYMMAESERLHSGVGTKIFWSPEFFDRDYGLKVDVWAMGVIMFGLLDGRFPFRDENDVKNKSVRFPKGTDPACEDYVRQTLQKDEAKRITAATLVQHKWINTVGSEIVVTDTPGSEEKWEADKTGLRENGVNEAVQERRRELVDRLENEKQSKDEKRIPKDKRQQIEHYWAEWFTIVDKHAANSTLKFEWWRQEKVESEGILNLTGAKTDAIAGNSKDAGGHAEEIGRMMTEHGIDVSKFGTDKAKSLEQLAAEVQSGAARMMLDATMHKKLVRVVDFVGLRISPSGVKGTKFLIEWAEQFPDGRKREAFRLPGTKKEPHENTKKVAQRILSDFLGMGDCGVVFDFKSKEVFEEEMESPSYPGVRTVYRKEILEGQVGAGLDDATLKRIGLPGSNWDFEDSKKNTKYMAWMSEGQCHKKQVKLRVPEAMEEVSGLVQAPIGLNETDLLEYLKKCKVDVSRFGEKNTKTLKDISTELIKGESSLMQDPNGNVLRVVDLVVVKIVNSVTGGILVQTEQQHPDGSKSILNRLPGAKRRPDENQFLTARRILRKQLKMDENHVNLDSMDVKIVEEEKDSPSYPGLRTVYRKRIISADLMKT